MVKLNCPKCEYEWDYGGNMQLATCPSCTRKIKVEGNQL